MKAEYLKKIDHAIRAAGTREPDEVLQFAGFKCIDIGTRINGFITRSKQTVFYGVNKQFESNKYKFGVYHEGAHYWCGHLDLPNFYSPEGGHCDVGDFFGFQHKMIASTESDANICAAHALIESEPFLEMLGYNNQDVEAYRKSLDSFEQAVKDYEYHLSVVQDIGAPQARINRMKAYRHELGKMYDELEEQAYDIASSGCILSKYEISRELGVPEYIVDLKIESLSYLNYSVATVELPSFSEVFSGWN